MQDDGYAPRCYKCGLSPVVHFHHGAVVFSVIRKNKSFPFYSVKGAILKFIAYHDGILFQCEVAHCGLAQNFGDVIMSTIASQITSLTIVYSTVYSDADQRKHQSSASLAFVRGIHRGLVNSLHKWPVTRKMFPFDDVIMGVCRLEYHWYRRWLVANSAPSITWTNDD